MIYRLFLFLAQSMIGLTPKWYGAFTKKSILLETRHGNQEIVGVRAIFYGLLYLLLQVALFYIVLSFSIKEVFPTVSGWLKK